VSAWRSTGAVTATVAAVLVLGAVTIVGLRSTAADPGAVPASPAAASTPPGADLFRAKGCVGCHDGPDAADSDVDVGPDLRLVSAVGAQRVAGLDARAYVRQSIQEPQAFVVPGFEPDPVGLMPALPLTAAEIDALVAWLVPS